MTTWWHEERLRGVVGALRDHGVARVLDLGCGAGDLVLRLLDLPEIVAITALDIDAGALERLRRALPEPGRERVRVLQGSMTAPPPLPPHDAAVLLETIEHLRPAELPALERVLFATLAPPLVLVTTPNAEFNDLLGVPRSRMRHTGHRFEWTRAQFRRWAEPVAARHGYRVTFQALGGAHPDLGGASQMALFQRTV